MQQQRAFSSEVHAAEHTIDGWLKDLKGRALQDIEAELGPPVERATWDFHGIAAPKLEYSTPGKGKVQVLYLENRAITALYLHVPE